MRVLSLFSGGGLGDYGLELAGMEIVGQVEIDDYCQKILKLRWPDVPKWTDIKNVRGKEILERVGTVDLISGGFPCQDISVANTDGEGISGSRSGLWKEMFRLVCQIRPRFVFVENVSNLLGRGLGIVLGDLASVGYDAEWECLPASAIGAPHQRDRLWILSYSGIERCNNRSNHRKKRPFLSNQRTPKKSQQERQGWECGTCTIDKAMGDSRCLEWKKGGAGFGENGNIRPSSHFERFGKEKPWYEEVASFVCGMDDGCSVRVDRLKLLGNGQVVQVVEWIGKQIMEFEETT